MAMQLTKKLCHGHAADKDTKHSRVHSLSLAQNIFHYLQGSQIKSLTAHSDSSRF